MDALQQGETMHDIFRYRPRDVGGAPDARYEGFLALAGCGDKR